MYCSEYRYTVKEDAELLLSNNYPDLNNNCEPRTEKAISEQKRKGKQTESRARIKEAARKGMSIYDATHVIQTRDISSQLKLVVLAVQQNRTGKSNLVKFIANRGQRVVDKALQLANKFTEAEAELARRKKRRLELLDEAFKGECVSECNNRWPHCTMSLIENNGILLHHFCESISAALHLG